MISARFRDNTNTAYNFKLADGTEGTNHPDGARWAFYEQLRIDSGVAIDPFVEISGMQKWLGDMEESDRMLLPRWAEDMYDTLPQLSKDGAAPALQSKVAQKKLLRQSKPV